MGLVKLLNILATKELVAGWSRTDVNSGSVMGCILEVALAIGIVVDDMKVMVVGGVLKLIVVCSSIILMVANGTTVTTSVISADILMAMEANVFEFPWMFSTLEVVNTEGTEAEGAVEDGMSMSLIDIPLPSSPVIIPAVSGQIGVQLRSRSRQ